MFCQGCGGRDWKMSFYRFGPGLNSVLDRTKICRFSKDRINRPVIVPDTPMSWMARTRFHSPPGTNEGRPGGSSVRKDGRYVSSTFLHAYCNAIYIRLRGKRFQP